MESVRAGCDMLHYFVMILYFVLILLLGVFTCFAGIRLGLGLAGKWRKGMDLLFASYWWDSFSSSWPLSLKGVRERLIR